jgi:hypothetical protein
MATTAYCSGCGQAQAVDAHWRELTISSVGVLKVSPPFEPQLGDFFPESVLCCGQGSALALIERYLHNGTFEPAQAHIPQPQPATEGDSAR